MKVRFANQDDKRSMYDVMWYCFPEPESWHKHEENQFNPKNNIVIEEEDGSISTALALCPFEMHYAGTIVPMEGLSAIASSPDTRYSGNTGKLLNFSIEQMYKRGAVFSPLSPFDYSFYRKYGWEICFDRKIYEIKMSALSKFRKNNYSYKLIKFDESHFTKDIHSKFYSKYIGSAELTDASIEERKALMEEMGYKICVCKDEKGKITAFMRYTKKEKEMAVREMVWSDISSLKALWGFIYRHNSEYEKVTVIAPTDDPTVMLLDDKDCSIKMKSDMMMRIVNVKGALEKRVYDSKIDVSFNISIKDEQAKWNNGTWSIKIKDSKCLATKNDTNPDVAMDIQPFTQLTMGYADAQLLFDIGKIENANSDTIKTLALAFPKMPAFMNERF